jgi:hypothetical protein
MNNPIIKVESHKTHAVFCYADGERRIATKEQAGDFLYNNQDIPVFVICKTGELVNSVNGMA